QSIITNKKGEFSFIVPNGSYYLKTNSTEYNFPSKRLRKTSQELFKSGITDGTYSNLYFGERILINKENPQEKYALNINIPLDKTPAFNLEERMIKILRVIGNILIKIKWPSIVLGTALSVFSFWSNFSILNLIILELYLILILYEVYRLLAKSRPYGLVLNQQKSAIDLALVRFNDSRNKIMSTAISGRDGKFTAQVDPGDYKLSTKKNGFIEDRRRANIKSARQLEKLDIELKRI
ncbi:carboxypeptidase-like regulatory domain-containing protein, partial [Patescibacteria group bacterium]|nr:carboxypeptidase-like regulatory domain-containing protein [Patescibacteria group bacterium]